jgi:DNA-binding transcriptional regulator YiaG
LEYGYFLRVAAMNSAMRLISPLEMPANDPQVFQTSGFEAQSEALGLDEAILRRIIKYISDNPDKHQNYFNYPKFLLKFISFLDIYILFHFDVGSQTLVLLSAIATPTPPPPPSSQDISKLRAFLDKYSRAIISAIAGFAIKEFGDFIMSSTHRYIECTHLRSSYTKRNIMKRKPLGSLSDNFVYIGSYSTEWSPQKRIMARNTIEEMIELINDKVIIHNDTAPSVENVRGNCDLSFDAAKILDALTDITSGKVKIIRPVSGTNAAVPVESVRGNCDSSFDITKTVDSLSDITSGKVKRLRSGAGANAAIPVANVRNIRSKMNISQRDFSKKFGLSLSTIRNWEQGSRSPEQPASLLLHLIDEFPDFVSDKVRKLSKKPQG